MAIVRLVQNPADLLSGAPSCFEGVLVEPFRAAFLCDLRRLANLGHHISPLVLRTDEGLRAEAELPFDMHLQGDLRHVTGLEAWDYEGTDARLRKSHPNAMASMPTPHWSRAEERRLLRTITLPAGTRVRVELFDALEELACPGGYRAATARVFRVTAQRVVVIADGPVSPSALVPAAAVVRPPARHAAIGAVTTLLAAGSVALTVLVHPLYLLAATGASIAALLSFGRWADRRWVRRRLRANDERAKARALARVARARRRAARERPARE